MISTTDPPPGTSGGHTGELPVTPRPGRGRVADSVVARLLDLLVDAVCEDDLLPGICELALESVPGCDGASITLLAGEPRTVAVTHRRFLALEAAQYRSGDGPCVRAVRSDTESVLALDRLADGAGPGFGWLQVARSLGLTAVLSTPLPSTARIRAGLNLYTAWPGGWRDDAVDAVDTLATYAGDALAIASRLAPP